MRNTRNLFAAAPLGVGLMLAPATHAGDEPCDLDTVVNPVRFPSVVTTKPNQSTGVAT